MDPTAGTREITFILCFDPYEVPMSLSELEMLITLKALIQARFDLAPEEQEITGWPESALPLLEDFIPFSCLDLPDVLHLTVTNKNQAPPTEAARSSGRNICNTDQPSSGYYQLVIHTENADETVRIYPFPSKINLRFAGNEQVWLIKEEVGTLTNTPRDSQVWKGWPHGTTNNCVLRDLVGLRPSVPLHLTLCRGSEAGSSSSSQDTCATTVSRRLKLQVEQTLPWHKCESCGIYLKSEELAVSHKTEVHPKLKVKAESSDDGPGTYASGAVGDAWVNNLNQSNQDRNDLRGSPPTVLGSSSKTTQNPNVPLSTPLPAIARVSVPFLIKEEPSSPYAAATVVSFHASSPIHVKNEVPEPEPVDLSTAIITNANPVTSSSSQAQIAPTQNLPAASTKSSRIQEKEDEDEDDKPYMRPQIRTIADLTGKSSRKPPAKRVKPDNMDDKPFVRPPIMTIANLSGGTASRNQPGPSRLCNNDNGSRLQGKDDKPLVRPKMKTLADLKGRGKGQRGRGRGKRSKLVDRSDSDDSDDEDYEVVAKKSNGGASGRGRGTGRESRGRGRGVRSGRGDVASTAGTPSAETQQEGRAPTNPWESEGIVLSTSGTSPPETASERRDRLVAAAQQRIQERDRRGCLDPSTARREQHRKDERDRRIEEVAKAGTGEAALKWTL